MSTLVAGQKLALPGGAANVQLQIFGGAKAPEIDALLIGLDTHGKLSDERYLVYFNNTSSPEGAISQTAGGGFSIDLLRVPNSLHRLQLSLALLNGGSFGSANQFGARLTQAGHSIELALNGADFGREQCLIALELYRKDGTWRVGAVAQGFVGGMDALLRSLGAVVESTAATTVATPSVSTALPAHTMPRSAPASVSLEKRVAAAAPALVSLAKSASVSLTKHRLDGLKARVGLVLDCSGSMERNFSSGRVQAVVDRLVPLAMAFDDDGEIDFWTYADSPKRQASISAANYRSAVKSSPTLYGVGYGNDECRVIGAINSAEQAARQALPYYVLFITDGGIAAGNALNRLIIESSNLPIFWQFVGLGGTGYGPLEQLDRLTGRKVDNANFFAVDDLAKISSDALYDRLLAEFPAWLSAAKAARIF